MLQTDEKMVKIRLEKVPKIVPFVQKWTFWTKNGLLTQCVL